MALVTKSARASVETGSAQRSPQVVGIAGENIGLAAPCYIDNTTGKIFQADGTAANQKALIAGFAVRQANTNEAVTLHGVGTMFHYSDTVLTYGAKLYVAATAGALDTAATTGDAVGIAQVMPDGKTIRVTRNI